MVFTFGKWFSLLVWIGKGQILDSKNIVIMPRETLRLLLITFHFRLIRKATDKIANIKALTSERGRGWFILCTQENL